MSNIIFLMADQLRYDLLDAYGDQQCDTPNLDALADEATVFEHHYTICPLCVPARSSLMTGLYPRQHGAIINGWFPEEREHGTVNANIDLIPNRIADQGYDVYHAGIQHVRTTGGFEKACPNVNFIGPSSVGKHHRMLHKKGLMLPDMSVFRNPVLEHSEGKQRITAGTSARTAVWNIIGGLPAPHVTYRSGTASPLTIRRRPWRFPSFATGLLACFTILICWPVTPGKPFE